MSSVEAETRRSRNECVVWYTWCSAQKLVNKSDVISIAIITQIARFTTAGTNHPPPLIFIKNELCVLFLRSV